MFHWCFNPTIWWNRSKIRCRNLMFEFIHVYLLLCLFIKKSICEQKDTNHHWWSKFIYLHSLYFHFLRWSVEVLEFLKILGDLTFFQQSEGLIFANNTDFNWWSLDLTFLTCWLFQSSQRVENQLLQGGVLELLQMVFQISSGRLWSCTNWMSLLSSKNVHNIRSSFRLDRSHTSVDHLCRIRRQASRLHMGALRPFGFCVGTLFNKINVVLSATL